MPSIIVRRDGKPAREVILEQGLTVIGSKVDADIVIDAPAGCAEPDECASIMKLGDSFIFNAQEAGGSILVNGLPVKKSVLKDRDLITIAEYRMTFQDKRETEQPLGIEGEAAEYRPQAPAPQGLAMSADPFRSKPAGSSRFVIYLVIAAIVAGICFASYRSYLVTRAADAQAAQDRKAYDEKQRTEAEKMQEDARTVPSSIKP